MRRVVFAWLAVALAGCGMTFGVEAVSETTAIEQSAEGVDRLVVDQLGLEDELVVCGEGEMLRASIEAIGWQHGKGNAGQAVEASFEVEDAAAALTIRGGNETLSLRRIEISAPSQLETSLSLREGDLRVCDFAGAVAATAEAVTLEHVTGPATSDAEVTTVSSVAPIDLEATGSVVGELEAGGRIVARGGISLVAASAVLEGLEVENQSGDGPTEIALADDQGYTISIRTGGYAAVEVGDVSYASDAEGAASPADGIVFEVLGGGPTVQVTAELGNIVIVGRD